MSIQDKMLDAMRSRRGVAEGGPLDMETLICSQSVMKFRGGQYDYAEDGKWKWTERRDMMWTKRDALEKSGCLGNAADNEPVFILRGQDMLMPETLEAWASFVERANGGLSTEKSREARKFANEVRGWQQSHFHKIPD